MLTFLKTILIIFLVLWVLTMVIYFFNLDMKLMAVLYKWFEPHYDKVKRDKKL